MKLKSEAGRIVSDNAIPGELLAWVENSVASSTGSVYLRNFMGWYRWLQEEGPEELQGLSPMELARKQHDLNWNRELMKDEKKIIVHSILKFVNREGLNWRTGYKRKVYSSVSAFFGYKIEPGLPKLTNGEKLRLKGEPRAQKNLTIQIIKEIIDNSNAMYKAIWSCMLASGMGSKELIEVSDQGIEALRKKLANPIRRGSSHLQAINVEELIEIYLPSRKSNINTEFYVYIGGSALKFLRTYVKHRDDREARFYSPEWKAKRSIYYRAHGKEEPILPERFPDAVFVNNHYRPLRYNSAQFYWISQLEQLKKWKSTGSKRSRTNMNQHQIRSVFKTRGARSEVKKDMRDYFMGHEMDSLDYDQIARDPEYRIEQYLKLLPWVDIDKIHIEQQSQESDAQKHELEEAREAIAELQLRMKELEQEKYLAEHSLDYTLARMDEAGVPVNPDTEEADFHTQAHRVLDRQMSLDPEGAIKNLNERTRALEEAYKKGKLPSQLATPRPETSQ